MPEQLIKDLTAAIATATVASSEASKGGEVATATEDGVVATKAGAPSMMDNVKDTVTDKKFLGGAGIGFLAGAATGAVVTHVVQKKKDKKKKKKKKGSSSSSSSSDSDY